MLVKPEVLFADAETDIPAEPCVDPVLMPLFVSARPDEVLHLHLLELAGPEDEVTRGYLVTERLTDLPDTERDLPARALQDVAVVDEDPLRRLRTQVRKARLVLHRSEVGAQQAVEHAGLGERALGTAVRAGYLGKRVGRRVTVLCLVRVDEVIYAESLMAGQAFGERIHELGDVPAGLPHLPGEDHAGVEADDLIALLHDRPPPLLLDVVFQLDT